MTVTPLIVGRPSGVPAPTTRLLFRAWIEYSSWWIQAGLSRGPAEPGWRWGS